MHRWLAGCLLLTFAALLAAGCASTSRGQRGSDEPLPTLDEIRSTQMSAEEDEPAEEPRQRVVYMVSRIDVPLEQDLAAAWDIVNEEVFPPITRGVWHANGIRLGVLPVGRSEKFLQALPPTLGIRRQRLMADENPLPLVVSPALREPLMVDLTIPPFTVQEEQIERGRAQILAKFGVRESGEVLIELTPHHHRQRPSIRPRTAAERALDGRQFTSLSVSASVRPQSLLVIGLYWPWPKPETPESEESDGPAGPDAPDDQPMAAAAAPRSQPDTDASQPADADGEDGVDEDDTGGDAPDESELETSPVPPDPPEQAKPEDGPPPLPNHLGRALFTAVRYNKPIQTLLIVSAAPAERVREASPSGEDAGHQQPE